MAGMMNTVQATPGQIEKINQKYVPGLFSSVNVVYDGEDHIFFITVDCATYSVACQVMNSRRLPECISVRKGDSRYDVRNPDPTSPLYTRLKELSDKAIKDWEDGNLL